MINDEFLYARIKEVENEIKASQSSLVESDNGFPPIPSKDRYISWSDFWAGVAITARKELNTSLLCEKELREFIQKMRNYFNEFAEDAVRPDEWIMREWVRKCDKQLKAAVTGE